MLTAIFWETIIRRFTDLWQMNLRKEVCIYMVNTDCTSELLGFWTLSIVRYSKNYKTMFRKLDVFPPSGDRGDIYSVGSLRKG
jgi:hypothetical protein